MKKSFLLFVLLCVTTLIFAQTETQTATLKHGDNITAFYGNNAFVNAHEAAADGDIITLSSGSFAPTTITKAITLRGAGCMEDPELLTLPTSITGEIHARIGGENRHLTIEGIIFPDHFVFDSLYSPTFIRCSFEVAPVYGRCGIGIYGPALDQKGNCIAGCEMMKHLSREMGLHMFQDRQSGC